MWNWICFSENGELHYLLKSLSYVNVADDRGKVDFAGQYAYESIQDEMINTFGISQEYLTVMQAKIRIEKMYAKYLAGDKALKLLITIEEIELEKLEKAPTKVDLQETLFQIEQIQGVRYNPKEITVYEFYKLAKLVSKK